MGQYFLSIYFEWQIGFMARYDNRHKFLEVHLPFMKVMFGLNKSAKGLCVNDHEL